MNLRKAKVIIEIIIILMAIVFIWQALNNNLSKLFGASGINIYVGILVILGTVNLILSYMTRNVNK